MKRSFVILSAIILLGIGSWQHFVKPTSAGFDLTEIPTASSRYIIPSDATTVPILNSTSWPTFTYRSSAYVFVPYPPDWKVDIVESSLVLSHIRITPPPGQLQDASSKVVELRVSW